MARGVMSQLPHILAPFAAGGDALIMICLWQLGVAVSDPGFSFYHSDLRMFDSPSTEGRHLLYALTEALAKRCDPSCQVGCIAPLHGHSLVLAETCLLWQGAPDPRQDSDIHSLPVFWLWLRAHLPGVLTSYTTLLMPKMVLLQCVMLQDCCD